MILLKFELAQSLLEMFNKFFSTIPNIVGALVMIIVGLIVSKMIRKVSNKMLAKSGIDKLADKLNGIEIVEKSNFKIKFSELFSSILYYFILLFFVVISAEILGMPAVSNLVADIFAFIPNVIVAIIILIIGIIVADMLKSLVKSTCESLGVPSAGMIANFVFYFILVNIFISALSQAKISTEFLSQNISLIIGGIVLAFAIGYGLASKDIISNYLGSLYAKNKIAIGDKVQLGEDTGEIVDIDKATVTILSNDRRMIYPLKKIFEDKITIYNN